MDENWTRKTLTALVVVLLGGGGAAYMLMHLDHAARRQLSGLKYWYPNKILGNDIEELKKISITCLIISIICAIVFIFRLRRIFG